MPAKPKPAIDPNGAGGGFAYRVLESSEADMADLLSVW